MPRRKVLQTNFSAGELAPDIGARQDTEQYQNGAKSLLNRRCLIGGGTKRRPGSWRLPDLPGPSRLDSWVVNRQTQYVVAFGDGRFHAFLRTPAGGKLTAASSVSSCPWTGDRWSEINTVQSADTMFVVHPEFRPQVLRRTGQSSWSLSDFAFYEGPAGRPEQPYLKFAEPGVTLQPSALTGSITLTIGGTTDAWFEAAHVDTYVRYQQKACLITAVAPDGLSCTATVIETLPDTLDLTVSSTAHFAVGEAVAGSQTGAKGLVTTITDSTHLSVVITDALTIFTTSDTLTGPNGTTTISNVGSASTKAAVTDWDEQMFSDVWGYPSCVTLHRGRLLFGGHAAAPDYLIGSALNNLYNFNVGDGSDGDAIMEPIGDDAASRIVQLHSAEQLLLGTDRGLYYVPESASSPFRPSSIAFFSFGSPWPITGSVRHEPFDNGVLALSGSLVIKARPTGDVNHAWEADEVSLLAYHMVDMPTDMAVTSNFGGGPERYALLRNSDGTLAVMQLVEKQNIRNFTPWTTTGSYDSVTAIEDSVYVACTRAIAGNTIYTLELFDQGITLDCATEYTSLTDVEADYGGTTVQVVIGLNRYLGALPLSLTTVPSGPYVVGLYFDSRIETLPPVIDDSEGDAAGDLMRICDAKINVLSSQRFAAEGRTLQAYSVTDDIGQPPPDKNGWQQFGFLGWEESPTLVINQPDPLPLTVLAIKTTVAF